MRIALDGRTVHDHFPGIGRYTYNLAAALGAAAPQLELLLLHNPSGRGNTRYELESLALQPNVRLVPVDVPIFSAAEQWRLPTLLRQLQPDIYHAPYYIMPYRPGVSTVVTLYDLVPLQQPRGYSPFARLMFAATVRLAARAAAQLITLSRASARDLQRRFSLPQARLTVIPLAADPAFVPQPAAAIAALRARLGLPENYLLYFGSNKPHKNLPRLVRAFMALQDTPPLVIAGHWDPRFPEARQLAEGAGLRVRFLGPVTSGDLPALYSGALLFVFPSLAEGFGLPPLEAMACGAPVVCSGASSLPEVVGDAGLLFDPADTAALQAALQRALADSGLRQELRQRGQARAAQFTWRATAEQTAAVYARACQVQNARLRP
jgi:alpha-1,3-rhamnosyl/mannosyltransferase